MPKALLYGGDYNPEQWLHQPKTLETDLIYMKECGINTVTMGVFSWAALEPQEGRYDFDWLEERMNRLYEKGIYTILATPSAARPKWLADKHPEVLRVEANRVRNLFGGRHNHCYTSPVYREYVDKINTALAKRFAAHPAVRLWHISNEYGGECHCPLCQEAFRSWLRRQYQDIDILNQSWCTSFWSHTYQSFEQIESPSPIGENGMHGLSLDWKRFVTVQTADFARNEIKALRAAGASQPTTVNLMYDYRGLNYDLLADCVDIISWDSYPVWHKGEEILTARDNGMQHDYMRCLKKRPFLLMESSPSATNWQGISKLKRPGLLTAASLQALAHGADSVLYFQLRQSAGGAEKFHGAVIDHYGGNDTRVFKEVREIGQIMEQLDELKGSQVASEAAIIYDVENSWALEDSQGPRNKGMYYHEAVMKAYQALKKTGINVDIISQRQCIDDYKLVIAPMLYLFRAGIEDKIRAFVAAGGHFAATYWTGIADRADRCFQGGTPYRLMDVFGLRKTETDSLYDGEHNLLIPAAKAGLSKEYRCGRLCDLLEIYTAEPLFYYGKEFYRGTPAVTRNLFEKGVAYYIGADAEALFYDDFCRRLILAAKVTPLLAGTVPAGVEVSSRSNEAWEYIFIQNYGREEADISGMDLAGEILYGAEGGLPSYGTVIIKRKRIEAFRQQKKTVITAD